MTLLPGPLLLPLLRPLRSHRSAALTSETNARRATTRQPRKSTDASSCLGRPLSLVVAQDTVHGAAIRRSSDDEEVVAGSQLCGAAGRDQASIS